MEPEPQAELEPTPPSSRSKGGLPAPVAALVILAGLAAVWTIYQRSVSTKAHLGAWVVESSGAGKVYVNFDSDGGGQVVTRAGDDQPEVVGSFDWKATGAKVTCFPDDKTTMPASSGTGQPVVYAVQGDGASVTLTSEHGEVRLVAPAAPAPPG